jgi:hypothetical protein
MKINILLYLICTFIPFFISGTELNDNWINKKHEGYEIYYTPADIKNMEEYVDLIDSGKKIINDFFQKSFQNEFKIIVHPSRLSIDSTWQKDWKIPEFKSQCWMVASGIGDKLDIISPKMWDSLTCEHSYSNFIKTQQLITHELVHVFHGQQNKSPDFSDITSLDWFVEGLATYVSGQCDSLRIANVKNAISNKNIPDNLDMFWSGKLRYGLSGTVVMYLDKQYGKEKMFELLKYNTLQEVLNSLNTTESEIIRGWNSYIKQL